MHVPLRSIALHALALRPAAVCRLIETHQSSTSSLSHAELSILCRSRVFQSRLFHSRRFRRRRLHHIIIIAVTYDSVYVSHKDSTVTLLSVFPVQRQHIGLDQRSYSTLGPVSAQVGDRLWTGRPPRRRTRHPGLLSLCPPSVAGWNEYPAKAGVVNRHIA